MKALLENQKCGLNRSHRKEKNFTRSFILVGINSNHEIETLLDVRFYNTSARSYCCLWLHGCDTYASGSGYAGGWGYHRDSESFSRALVTSGIDLTSIGMRADIGGQGDGAIKDAMMVIGNALGFRSDQLEVICAHA